MICYHGSDTIVDIPRILEAKRPLDFGGGFYVTTSEKQARSWATKIAYRNNNHYRCVNRYEFDLEKAKLELLLKILPKKKINIYVSLLGAMIVGRIVWGIVMFCIMGFDVTEFGRAAFWAGAVVNAIPGIIVQIILIPMLIMVLEKAKLMPNKSNN